MRKSLITLSLLLVTLAGSCHAVEAKGFVDLNAVKGE
ncbi:hypothetical protein J2125_000955 [Erwinia toletana]|uniref:Uncharacterized protein n=1 Tax=Winslowiella toletana TaxID=92490 RepID=A0ABS4P551_9GAMM|nr:hypothetical protein [Winslowiella toletana]